MLPEPREERPAVLAISIMIVTAVIILAFAIIVGLGLRRLSRDARLMHGGVPTVVPAAVGGAYDHPIQCPEVGAATADGRDIWTSCPQDGPAPQLETLNSTSQCSASRSGL